MIKSYLLAFSDTLGTRDEVKQCLDVMSIPLTWRYDMNNAFYIVTEASAAEIADKIREHFKNNGLFIIAEVGGNKEGWLTKDSWYFLNDKKMR